MGSIGARVEWMEKLSQVMHRMTWERYYPLLGGIFAGIGWGIMGPEFPQDRAVGLLIVSVTFGSITAGFLATSLAVLLGMDSRVMRQIRTTRYVGVLTRYLAEALAFDAVLITVAFVGFFLGDLGKAFGCIWFAALIMILLALIRIVDILLGLLQHPVD